MGDTGKSCRGSFATFLFGCSSIVDVKAHVCLKLLRSVLISGLSIGGSKLLVPFDAVWLVSIHDE